MSIYRLESPDGLVAPTIVVAFDGWVDAGAAATTALGTLLPDSRIIATFDPDALYDYRARRPTLDIIDGRLAELGWPELHLRAVRAEERDLIILTGPEPDDRWRTFADAMVELATEDELSAVLAHEIGHVQHRHGVQQILRTSILAALLVMIGPDAGTISTLASGLPAVLIESGYSREFEREADLYACDALVRTGRDPQGLARALERLAAQSGETSLPAWVSTHPQTQERIEAIRTFGR